MVFTDMDGFKKSKLLGLSWLTLLLGACASEQGGQVIYSGSGGEPESESVEEVVEPRVSESIARARLLADILYDAKLAYEDNRLTSPPGNNAYDRYLEVLSLDPGNQVARQGIEEVVLRYIELAETALRQRKFDEAQSLLARAAGIDPDRPELAPVRQRLESVRDLRVERYELDPRGVSEQSLLVMTELARIASQIMRSDATFLINARSDAEGRWIYKVMRESVGGYRLRGNIDIAASPEVVVTMPPASG